MCALKLPDINFETKELRITKTIYSEDNNMRNYELTPPKTAGSVRTITLDDQIIDILKAHVTKQKKLRLQSRIDPIEYHDGNFLFARENGYPFYQKISL